LEYCYDPKATFLLHASLMQLTGDSNASNLSVPQASCCKGGYFYFSSCSESTTPTPINDAIKVFCQMMPKVLSSDAKAELGTLFHNSKEAYPLQTALNKIRHLQAPTPLITNNSTAARIANNTVKQSCSKAINMRFYWIRDRIWQGRKQKT
jgi:hypothetical protein